MDGCQSEDAGRGASPGCGRALTSLGQAQLFLFFSRGSSLANWEQAGTLERETALYRALAPHLGGVHFVTYGRRDRRQAAELGGIQIHDNRYGLPLGLYARLLGLGLEVRGQGPAVVKTNQMQGADIALAAARRCGYAFLARCGYLPSNIATWRHGQGSPQAAEFLQLEAKVLGAADRVAVTTPAMAVTVIQRYGVDPGRVSVVPNFVDTDLFRPLDPEGPERQDDLLLYVGRLHEEKNLLALFHALRDLPLRLELIGEGPLQPRLADLAQALRLKVRFLGRVENRELPWHLARAGAFVLPSKGEHHPKALLEAMSAGVPVLGTRAPGIAELVEHGRTGWLCGLSAPEIRTGLEALMGDLDLRENLGRSARAFVLENFTFARVLDLELALLGQLVG